MAKKLPTYEGVFEALAIQPRHLQNGDKIRVILETPFTREKWDQVCRLALCDVKVFMEEFEQQPDLEGVDEQDE